MKRLQKYPLPIIVNQSIPQMSWMSSDKVLDDLEWTRSKEIWHVH
jgi:hypothetical protein